MSETSKILSENVRRLESFCPKMSETFKKVKKKKSHKLHGCLFSYPKIATQNQRPPKNIQLETLMKIIENRQPQD